MSRGITYKPVSSLGISPQNEDHKLGYINDQSKKKNPHNNLRISVVQEFRIRFCSTFYKYLIEMS